MEGETSKTLYKIVEYNNTLYQIPIRNIEHDQVLLLTDVQSIVPKATAFLSDTKLIPFELDPISHTILIPKRVSVSTDDNIWQIKVPQDEQTCQLLQSNTEMQIKMEQLSQKFDRILALHQEEEDTRETESDNTTEPNTDDQTTITEPNTEEQQPQQQQQQQGPPPAFSSPSHASSSSHRQEAPPSYETSVLNTIKAINSKLCLYESHIYNRHKSPRWLAKREEWISRIPNSIEEVAYQLIQLEMALLWTAVTESWIQERETWLTLVANARSERHLAGAIINLERHTLVMDENWANIRERWINDLLEMLVLPISHG